VVQGKSCETFNPAGPWLVTPDEIDDVLNLGLWLDVNNVRRQTGSTSEMIFNPYFIVHYLSHSSCSSRVISSTPVLRRVSHGPKTPVWLEVGDVMELRCRGTGHAAPDHCRAEMRAFVLTGPRAKRSAGYRPTDRRPGWRHYRTCTAPACAAPTSSSTSGRCRTSMKVTPSIRCDSARVDGYGIGGR